MFFSSRSCGDAHMPLEWMIMRSKSDKSSATKFATALCLLHVGGWKENLPVMLRKILHGPHVAHRISDMNLHHSRRLGAVYWRIWECFATVTAAYVSVYFTFVCHRKNYRWSKPERGFWVKIHWISEKRKQCHLRCVLFIWGCCYSRAPNIP